MDKWNDLVTFTEVSRRLGNPFVSISRKGVIMFNSALVHRMKEQLTVNTHALLHYSKTNEAIVVSFTPDKDKEGALKMTVRSNASIAGKTFLDFYKFDLNKIYGRYPPEFEDIPGIGKCLVIYWEKKIK